MTDRLVENGPVLAEATAPKAWLTSATNGLVALLDSDAAAARPLFTEAGSHDGPRTATFCLLVLALTGDGDLANMGWLDNAFPRLPADKPVTRAQRAVWMAASEGAFGEVGRALVRSRTTSLVGRLDDERRDNELPDWRAGVAELPLPIAAPRLPEAAALSALRVWCAQATAVFDEPDDEPRLSDDTVELIRSVVGALILAGDPRGTIDAPLVADLRPGDPATAPWDDPAGTSVMLLREDAFDAAHPPLRTIAVRAAKPWLTTIAEDLAAASAIEPPEQIVAELANRPVRLHAKRPLERQLARVYTRMDAGVPPRFRERNFALGILALGLLVALLGFGSVAVLLIGAAIAGLGGGWAAAAEQNRRFIITTLNERKRQAADDAQAALDDLEEHRAEAVEIAGQAARDLASINTSLTR
jgi:hypothetical protein